METRSLGASGLRVTLVGLGCNNFGGRIDFAATQKVVDKALDLGINHFDTADIYGNKGGSEDFLGRTLGERRKNIVLATKIGKPMDAEGKLAGGSRSYVTAATEASLKRLRTDWIDLLYMHEPDVKTPVEETLRALDDLTKAERSATSPPRTTRRRRSGKPSTPPSVSRSKASSPARTSSASSTAT